MRNFYYCCETYDTYNKETDFLYQKHLIRPLDSLVRRWQFVFNAKFARIQSLRV